MTGLSITEISVKNLFGKTNIKKLKLHDTATNIITAPNGCGKTTLFDIIEFIFGTGRSGRSTKMKSLPFDNAKITLSNGKTVVLERLDDHIHFKLSIMNDGKTDNSVEATFEDNYEKFQECLEKSKCLLDIVYIRDIKFPNEYIIECLKHDINNYIQEYMTTISTNKFLLGDCDEITEHIKDAISKTESIREKLQCLKNVMDKRRRNERCDDKTLVYDKNKGVLFDCEDISCWSSGEIADFIMFYSMICMPREADGNLILIDTPETSLHIVLQETYMDYVNEICAKKGYHAMIATHSPYIVANYSDNVVSLVRSFK